MALIPIDDIIAADLAKRGVYPLMTSDCVVPDDWMAILGRLQGGDDAIQPVDRALNGSLPKRDR